MILFLICVIEFETKLLPSSTKMFRGRIRYKYVKSGFDWATPVYGARYVNTQRFHMPPD